MLKYLLQGAQDVESQGIIWNREIDWHWLAPHHKTTVEKVFFKTNYFQDFEFGQKQKTTIFKFRPSLDEGISSKEEGVQSVEPSENNVTAKSNEDVPRSEEEITLDTKDANRL